MNNKNIIRIVGIDPSLRNTGLALAEVDIFTFEWKVIDLFLAQTQSDTKNKVVRKSSLDLASAVSLHSDLQAFFKRTGATLATGEVPTGAQSSRGSFSNGVCCGLLASVPVPLIEVSPAEVQVAALGYKGRNKEHIIEWAVARHPELPWPRRKLKGAMVLKNECEHLADACATIPAAIKTQQFQQAVTMMKSALGMPLAA